MAAEVGCPEAAKVVLEPRDKAPERHVAALIAQATVSRIDAVIQDARAIFVEPAEALHGPVYHATSWRHRRLTHLGLGRHWQFQGRRGKQRGRDRIVGTPLPGRGTVSDGP